MAERKRTSLICQECGEVFYPVSGSLKQKYCSQKCKGAAMKGQPGRSKGIERPQRARIGRCPICGEEFRAVKDFKTDNGGRHQKYCSKECWSRRGQIKFNCLNCGNEFTDRKSNERKFCSVECAQLYHIGENAPAFKDGKSLERDRARESHKLTLWREAVYKRDNYTCQKCGEIGKLHAHHKEPWAETPEKRFDVDNGITLCEKCHGEIHDKDFANRRTKTCPDCGTETKGRGKEGRCRACSLKRPQRR